MVRRTWLILLVSGFAVVLFCGAWKLVSKSQPALRIQALSQVALSAQPLPGVAWAQWRQSPDGRRHNPTLQNAIAAAIAQWEKRGVAANAFRVQHSKSSARLLDASCYPFEKRHAHGDAVDMRPADCNADGAIDVLDACLFAHSLETAARQNLRGAIGIYGRRNQHDSEFWIHIDSSGKTDRWGQLRVTQIHGVEVQPLIWSAHARAIRERAASWNLKLDRRSLKVVVRKRPSTWRFDAATQSLSVHPTLAVYAGQWPLKYFGAALGYDPIHDKQQRDDYRTPEGDFYLCGFNAQSRYHKSLRLSYPNVEDAARGLKSGLIDRATHNAIVRAIARGRTPPQDTRLGGDIMIHGGGIGRNWTWGCIALDNAAVDELFDLLPLRTRIKVL